jgi:peptidylprolyl isomerase
LKSNKKKGSFLMKYLLPVIFISFLCFGCGDDVVTTKSGLKYLDNKPGEGKSAEAGDIITLHISAWMVKDSTNLFDDWSADSTKMAYSIGSTKQQGEPVKMVLGSFDQMIKGSNEGITGMKPGGVRTIIIPSEMAYGSTGAGPIPPNTDLKLYVEVMDVKEAKVVKQWEYDSTAVKTTPSGLKYVILKEGEGEKADSNDVVTVHYSGFLLNGEKFDSSVERDEPFTLTLGRRLVIPGWEEGIALLNKGSKAKLIIPSELAYGQRDMGTIPPGSTLIFDVEIVDIKKN